MKTVYERLLAGETLTVQFAGQPEHAHKGTFTAQRLLLMGDLFYVNEGSEWARWAQVGGVRINGVRKHQMSDYEMREWCEGLEEVQDGED